MLRVWRIEKFKVVLWPQVGTFHTGDSFIVLSTTRKKDSRFEEDKKAVKLVHNIHFWLGLETTQDEAGTAAYKTVELDDFLGGHTGGAAVTQHREVEGFESQQFLALFKKTGGLNILQGGIDSGFNHVAPKTYVPRLLHVKGHVNVRIVQVPLAYEGWVWWHAFGFDGTFFL